MKKLYFKNMSNKNINLNLIYSLKNKYTFDTKTRYMILTKNSLYKYIKNNLYRFELLLKNINENEEYYECMEEQIKKNISNQIPIDHKFIIEKTINIKIFENIYLAFDIIDNNVNDYYIINRTNLGINDILLKRDLSYIKNMLI
tara:strand:+ start:64 stop:495 length:432 start_codon:yes stop_codon:yes gene_type:complete